MLDPNAGAIRTRRGERPLPPACDVADDQQVRRAVRAIVADPGPIDAVVNRAGIMREERIGKTERATIDRVIDTNPIGTINVCPAAIPALRQTTGAIVTTSSAQAHHLVGTGASAVAAPGDPCRNQRGGRVPHQGALGRAGAGWRAGKRGRSQPGTDADFLYYQKDVTEKPSPVT